METTNPLNDMENEADMAPRVGGSDQSHTERGSEPIALEGRIASAQRKHDALMQARELQRLEEEIAVLERSSAVTGELRTPSEILCRTSTDGDSASRRKRSDSNSSAGPRKKRSIKPKDPTPCTGRDLRQSVTTSVTAN